MSRRSPAPQQLKLTLAEVKAAFVSLSDEYPPILSLEKAAELAGYTPGTLKKKVSEGCFRNSASRGKPLRFWRDRFILEVMNKPASARPLPKPGPEKEVGDEAA